MLRILSFFSICFIISGPYFAMEQCNENTGFAINTKIENQNNSEIALKQGINFVSNDTEQSECFICHQELNLGQLISALQCNEGRVHFYCTECIRAWAKVQLTRGERPCCPYCLTKIEQDLIPASEKFMASSEALLNKLTEYFISRGHIAPVVIVAIYMLLDFCYNQYKHS